MEPVPNMLSRGISFGHSATNMFLGGGQTLDPFPVYSVFKSNSWPTTWLETWYTVATVIRIRRWPLANTCVHVQILPGNIHALLSALKIINKPPKSTYTCHTLTRHHYLHHLRFWLLSFISTNSKSSNIVFILNKSIFLSVKSIQLHWCLANTRTMSQIVNRCFISFIGQYNCTSNTSSRLLQLSTCLLHACLQVCVSMLLAKPSAAAVELVSSL